MQRMENAVWFITGCSGGLGQAIALAALQAGHAVVATSRQVEDLQTWEISWPDRCRVFELDVTQPRRVAEVLAQAHAAFGRLDVIVNNAGAGLLGALEEITDEQIEQNLRTNFLAPLAVTRAALPYLRAQRSGHIVNISAAAAISNYPGFAIYGGAKAALEAASESLKAEVAPLGIKVTLVQPGPFRTRFITRAGQVPPSSEPAYEATVGKFRQMLERMDGKQVGDPDKAARVIVEMAASAEPPFRLPLGKYVVKKTRDRAALSLRELERWEAQASSTEY